MSAHTPLLTVADEHRRVPQNDGWLITGAAVCAAVAGVVSPLLGTAVVAAILVAALFAVVAYRPIVATYTYLLTLPFVAGIERGALIPGVRLNEALLALLLAGAALGGYMRFVRGDRIPLRPGALDVPLIAFVFLSTVWPLASMMLRGQAPQGSDLAAVLPVCKLVALLLLVRMTVRTERQLVRCVRLIVWPAACIAVIAVLQTLRFGPMLSLLEAFWPAESAGYSERGTTTLGSSIATGDYVIVALTVLICCASRSILINRERVVLGFALGAGVLAAGQFSTWISAIVAGFFILRRFPELRRKAVRFLPVAIVAALIGAPAFLGRLADFGEGYALPRSWLGRWDNLTQFYLPQLGDFRFVLGVSPDSVLAAPETWREVIYLESGYLQFLWIGGIPLLMAFIWLSRCVLRSARQLGLRRDAVGVCAVALEIAWWMVVVLSVIDIHLVVRGFGDLLFVLLAITSGKLGDDRDG